jgi:MmyB-like transcription regulator ligand binding domain
MAWKKVAKDTVALLSAEAGRHPYDRRLSDLIGELSTRSDEFVSGGPPPTSRSTAPASSSSTTPSSAALPADPSQMLLTYTAEPESPSEYAPRLLVRWAATPTASSLAASTNTS